MRMQMCYSFSLLPLLQFAFCLALSLLLIPKNNKLKVKLKTCVHNNFFIFEGKDKLVCTTLTCNCFYIFLIP